MFQGDIIVMMHFRFVTMFCVLVTGAVTAQAEDSVQPHIVLCMADDQGWGDMAYNGHPVLKTPVFDEMAATCLRLDHFYAAAPVCSPTRASVMTGRTPNRSGVFSWGHSLRPQEVTIAEALKTAGYVTAHFGKWHLGSTLPSSQTSPGAQGFDRWLSAPNFFDVDPWFSNHGQAEQFKGESSELVVEQALQFLRDQSAEKPCLVVVWFGSPHSPHKGTSHDLALYEDQPRNQQHFLAEITAMDRAMGQLRSGLRDLQMADNTLLWYCSDNGAIPQGSTGGLRGKKGQIYEGGLRVPCLIEWPARIKVARQSDFPAFTCDIYPTLVEIAGAKVQQQPVLDGQSLAALFDGNLEARQRGLGFWDAGIGGFSTPSDSILAFVAEHQKNGTPVPPDHAAHGKTPHPLEWNLPAASFPGHSAWRDGDWKLHRIERAAPNGKGAAAKRARQDGAGLKWELYNLASDPAEQHDLFAAEQNQAMQLQSDLQAWLQSVTDSLKGADY